MDILDEVGLARVRGGSFFLHGDDEFRRDEVASALIEAHIDPATRDFNLDVLRGRDVDAETLASVLATPPMMAEWRVVVVRETEALAGSARTRDIVVQAAADPPPGLALILVCSIPQGSKARFYKELSRKARSLEFRALDEGDVPGWLMERARTAHGLEMDPGAAVALAAAVGTNLGILAQELRKLADFVGDGGRIGREEVEAAGTHLPRQDRWSWLDLVGSGRFDEALRGLDVLLAQGESGVGLIMALGTHLLRLGVAAEAGPRGLEEALPPHQRWLARRLAQQADGWSGAELDAAIEGLVRADRMKKRGFGDAHVLEEWLLTVMARRRAA